MKTFAFALSLLVTSACAQPAFCQLGGDGYHYSGGGARVVNQSQRAYRMPGSTAISTGTMSKSAQGVSQVGEQINPGLPRVHWGSTIGTCGDEQYKAGFQTGQARGAAVPNVAGTAITNTHLPGVNWGGSIGTAGDAMRSDFHPEVNTNNANWWRQQGGHRGNNAGGGGNSSNGAPAYSTPASGAATYEDPQNRSAGGLTY